MKKVTLLFSSGDKLAIVFENNFHENLLIHFKKYKETGTPKCGDYLTKSSGGSNLYIDFSKVDAIFVEPNF